MNWMRLYILLILCGISQGLLAQVFTTKVSAKTIGTLDAVEVDYISFGAELGDFVIPVFTDWHIISGPKVQTKTEPGGAIVSQQVVYILQPKKTGTLTVPGAKATINKTPHKSNPVTVEVKDVDHIGSYQPSAAPANPPSLPSLLQAESEGSFNAHFLKKGENAQEKINNNLLVKLQVSKNSCYKGEAILATYKLGTRLRSQSKVIKQPSFNGCTVIEMTTGETESQRELIDGKQYNVFVIRRVQLFPLQTGSLLLPEAVIDNNVSFYNVSGFSERELYYETIPVETHKTTLSSASAIINVKPLPAFDAKGKEVFSGAVGNFDIEIFIENEYPEANATTRLAFVIKGEGNVQIVKAPEIIWPEGFEAFEPVENTQDDKTYFPLIVRKTFSFPFVVNTPGEYSIPPVSFTYFEPNAGKYITKTTDPLVLNIAPASQAPALVNESLIANERDLKTRIYIIIGALLLAAIIAIVWYREKKGAQFQPEPATTIEHHENKNEPVNTAAFILKIRALHPDEDNSMFYKSMCANIHGFLEAKFGVNTTEIFENPANYFFNVVLAEKVKTLLHNCNMGMYTPVFDTAEAMQHRLTAIEVLSKIEDVEGTKI